MSVPVISEYRYITRLPRVCGGRPIIKGTRTPVKAIVGYYKMGLSVEEILEGLPHLTPGQVYEALSYRTLPLKAPRLQHGDPAMSPSCRREMKAGRAIAYRGM